MLAITESVGGYLRAGLMGLGGAITGGPISARYDISKEMAARQADAIRTGNPYEMYNANPFWKTLPYDIGGSIPIIGSITNMLAYRDRENAERKAKLVGEWGYARKRQPWDD